MSTQPKRTSSEKPARRLRIQASLGVGGSLEIGPVRIVNLGGRALVRYGERVTVLFRPRGVADAEVVCVADSSLLPEFCRPRPEPQETGHMDVREGPEAKGSGSGPPLLRLGPGGDYVHDIYPQNLMGTKESSENVPEPGAEPAN